MKIKLLILFCLVIFFRTASAQKPEEVYKKPLKEVLTDLQRRYNIKLQYSESLVRDLNVLYPTWRYRVDTEATLQNILLPLDMIYQKTGENSFRISKYVYNERPPEEGKKHLDLLLASYKGMAGWEERKASLKKCFFEQLKLAPMPKKTPLNPIVTPVRKFDGYTVENIALETIPGVYITGSLYKPLKGKGPFPAILCPYGHFSNPDTNEYGRYRPDMQYRCATLARMGAVVFSYDMFAWGESRLQFSNELHRTGLAQTMQTLNSIRIIDYLTFLSFVDGKRIGITGASGGGTQTFLAAALDERITVSVPCVMVSAYFFGGCPCESGMPIHSCTDLGTNNAEIAAMASPRPLLVISDGSDWTQKVPEIEFPYLQKVYELYGKKEIVENAHLPNDQHDYGINKRLPMYSFMAKHLNLNLALVIGKNGKIDESKVTIEKYDKLLVFGRNGKMPAGALRDGESVWKELKELQQ